MVAGSKSSTYEREEKHRNTYVMERKQLCTWREKHEGFDKENNYQCML